ncbi:uncharacterized protein TRIADDRAFT_60336 [Trichoplax adhaerens]|uniref:FAD dependent oxidoreductase domain-containing protein n=1 Tax=Trichoplax adhaerens TaxID=10228 RepID=B3S7Y1_TRIAD|nr:hypothetical protein TRIADDRAFT_60336 [Trichoplax adhaerens]EDV21014.1 hypothetical protein TRIADDRAFT_60336 [Trichoplax adhaerens]|eukprot:XP_002116344.1 hypothetical protein TRIADDRAFT_60336 [Trichoplax adhaerens]
MGDRHNTLGHYDITVIGAGSMGSACARHLTQIYKGKICLVGPDEPTVPRHQSGRSVFAAYYDQGRITRHLDADPVWCQLANRSIPRYRQLEKATGVQYYHERGFLVLGSKDDPKIAQINKVAEMIGFNYEQLSYTELKRRFPYLQVPHDFIGLYESTDAGYISPRGQVEAEIKAATDNGCTLVREIVNKVSRNNDGDYIIITETNKVITSRKIVVATGAFTLFKEIIPDDIRQRLDIQCGTQTVVKLQVNAADRQRYSNMPCMVYLCPEDPMEYWYSLPPVLYPDGQYYLKIGHGGDLIKIMPTHKDVLKWFHGHGDPKTTDILTKAMLSVLPGFKPVSIKPDGCAYTITPHSHVMIDKITENMVLLSGGNGYAAKSSDEIGRVGALTITHDNWHYDIPQEAFKLCFKLTPKL